jgi:hypothetical protein
MQRWPMSEDDIRAIHNEAAGRIVIEIVRPTIAAGGGPEDVLILLESVVTGVLTLVAKLGGDDRVLDVLVEGVRDRMAEIRLSGPSVGQA